MFLICIIPAAIPLCSASGIVVQNLGAAGPGNWGILIGPNTTDFAMNGAGTSNGNVGDDGAFSNTVQLNGSSGYKSINGNLYLASGDSVNDPAQVIGSIYSNFASLNPDWQAAVSASEAFEAMVATQTVSGGMVSGTTTIHSTGGINVIDISSLNLGNGQKLTLNGAVGDQFIINVSGKFVLNSGQIVLTGGLTQDDVVFNVTASGNAVQTSGGLNNESIINGILLAINSGIAMSPGLINGELIAGGHTVHLVSGASVNQVDRDVGVPEPSTYLLLGTGLLALGCIGRKRAAASFRRGKADVV